MFITGPDVIKSVTGEDVSFEDLGGAATHKTRSGVAHFSASDEETCFDDVRLLLSFLPENNLESAPYFSPTDDPEISSHPANCLMARIGERVDPDSIQQFDQLRFMNRFMY